QLLTPPMIVHCCHCRWCQRETGSAFVINAVIEADRVALLHGRPEVVPTPSYSGKGQKIRRCPTCRAALWRNYAGGADPMHFVGVGALDTPDALPPDVHIYTMSKQPWVILPDNKPAFPEFYRGADVWPADSIARRQALLAAAR